MRLFIFILLFSLFSCSTTEPAKPSLPTSRVVIVDEDPIVVSGPKLGKELDLWSTYYYLPAYKSEPGGMHVRDIKGRPLGPKLSHKSLCNLQLQGSGSIDGIMYGYAGKTSAHRVDCSSFSSKISGKVKFAREKNKYATGVKNWALTPFKSVAVDPKHIPYGTTLYIPELDGVEYVFENKKHVHDGIVKAQDTGGAIKGNHIDFFIGPVPGGWRATLPVIKPFSHFVKSKASLGLFKAYVVEK